MCIRDRLIPINYIDCSAAAGAGTVLMPYEKSKQEQEEGWDLAAYGAAYEADGPTSSFPQCRLTVCTAYLQVEIYSHIETHSHHTRTALAHTIMHLQVEIYSHIEIPHSHFNKNLNNVITWFESEF